MEETQKITDVSSELDYFKIDYKHFESVYIVTKQDKVFPETVEGVQPEALESIRNYMVIGKIIGYDNKVDNKGLAILEERLRADEQLSGLAKKVKKKKTSGE